MLGFAIARHGEPGAIAAKNSEMPRGRGSPCRRGCPVLVLVTAAVLFAGLAIVVLARLRACRTVESIRSVLVHVPIDRAWDLVRDFPALFAAHGRGRPLLRIESTRLDRGDGRSASSVWTQSGTWGGRPYWAEIEILRSDPPHSLAIRLVRDALGSERGLLRHGGELRLRAEGERSTKITWQLSARIHRLPMLLGRALAPERVEARLLDLSLRSLKVAIDGGTRPAGVGPSTPFPIPGRATAIPPVTLGAPATGPVRVQQRP